MIIALGYGSYCVAPALWDHFIRLAQLAGHQVHVVTVKPETQPVQVEVAVDGLHYTAGQPKRAFLESRGIKPRTWIDDQPENIGPRMPRNLAQQSDWASLCHRGDLIP